MQLCRNLTEELDHLLGSAAHEKAGRNGTHLAVPTVKRARQRLEGEVLDDVIDPRQSHGLIATSCTEHQAGV
jgi:hypothetical protein